MLYSILAFGLFMGKGGGGFDGYYKNAVRKRIQLETTQYNKKSSNDTSVSFEDFKFVLGL